VAACAERSDVRHEIANQQRTFDPGWATSVLRQ
jgi:hypothetical protein